MTKSKVIKAALTMALVLILVLTYLYAKNFLSIDACLDGGGVWDHAKSVCVE